MNDQNKTKLQTLRGIPTNFSGSDKIIISANSQKEFIFKLYCPLSQSMVLRELIKGNLEIQIDYESSKLVKDNGGTNPVLSDLSVEQSEIIL